MKDEEMADKHAEEYRKNFRYYRAWHGQVVDKSPSTIVEQSFKDGFLAGLKAGRPQWHKLDWEKDFPEADKLIRVRLRDGMERICETCYYEPTEDEIGYGKLVISFYELNGEWVDDNDVIAWCEIPTFDKE